MKKYNLIKTVFAVILMVSLLACNKEEPSANETPIENDPGSWTITVGAFSLDDGVYTDLGKELVFESQADCQTWSRTAEGDSHESGSHLHYNAATDVAYESSTSTFRWTEYGPEVDQQTIEATCAAGEDGVTKTVTETSYYKDKPNVYLKIIKVEEN